MCIAPFRRAPHELVRRVLVIVTTMTVSLRDPQQKFREDTVVPMEVLTLYADPIWPKLAGCTPIPANGCRFIAQPEFVLRHYTHRVSWNLRNCQVANSERCLT